MFQRVPLPDGGDGGFESRKRKWLRVILKELSSADHD